MNSTNQNINTIAVNSLTKTFKNGKSIVLALNKVNLEVNSAELFGLIGPDGAGKTSLFRILTTLLLPDSGTASLNGFDVVKDYKTIRKSIGYMPGKFSLYQDLTVEENLNFFATIFDTTIAENYDLVKPIYSQIEPFKNRKAGQLSGGMKQKLALSCALIHRPQILLLDEPTTGVDPVSRQEFWEMLKSLQKSGITILVSTPYMDEAALCDRIALIDRGKILSVDSPKKISSAFPDKLIAVKAINIFKLYKDLQNDKLIKEVFIFGEYLHCTEKEFNGIERLQKSLFKLNYQDIEVKLIEPTIEDCFMRLSSHE